MSITNGTDRALSDLRVQMCAMLRGLKALRLRRTITNCFARHWLLCRNSEGDRWVILGFEPHNRTWGNAPCPCLHSDPKFADCPPGETRRVHGWLSFYQGTAIDSELDRIEKVWQPLAPTPSPIKP